MSNNKHPEYIKGVIDMSVENLKVITETFRSEKTLSSLD